MLIRTDENRTKIKLCIFYDWLVFFFSNNNVEIIIIRFIYLKFRFTFYGEFIIQCILTIHYNQDHFTSVYS